jgi:hypothetical protein
MQTKKPRTSIKKKLAQPAKTPRMIAPNSKNAPRVTKVTISGDKNSQVLAATVGGAVLGNLIVPGIGGALIGGLVGALLGNDSRSKGRK